MKLSCICIGIREACRSLKGRKKKNEEEVKKFALLQLPELVLQVALRQMESIDLVSLSMCSKRTTEIIKLISRNSNADSVTIYLRRSRPCIKIQFRGFREDFFWTFDNDEELTKDHIQKKQIIDGYMFKTFKQGTTPPSITCSNEKVVEAFLKILQHFLRLFPAPLKIVAQNNLGDLVGLFKSPLLAKCSDLELTRGFQEEQYISNKDLFTICQITQVTDNFKAVVDTGSLVLHPVFTARNVDIVNGAWMREHDLLSMNCTRAKIRRHSYYPLDIEDFALAWQAKPSTPKLERLELTWDPLQELKFFGLETQKWDKNLRSKRCLKNGMVTSGTFDCSETYDFFRSDGLMASIGIIHGQHECILLFHAWHDRFPTKPHHDLLQKKLVDLRRQIPEINKHYGISGVAEDELRNPNLSLDEFQEMMTDVYNSRLAIYGSSPKLEHWFDFHNQILNVMEEIQQFD